MQCVFIQFNMLKTPNFVQLYLHNFKIKTVFVLSKDILSIDSFNTLKNIFELNHCQVVVISKLTTSDLGTELDVLRHSIFIK